MAFGKSKAKLKDKHSLRAETFSNSVHAYNSEVFDKVAHDDTHFSLREFTFFLLRVKFDLIPLSF